MSQATTNNLGSLRCGRLVLAAAALLLFGGGAPLTASPTASSSLLVASPGTSIPEPLTTLLLGTFLIGAAWVARRHSKRRVPSNRKRASRRFDWLAAPGSGGQAAPPSGSIP